MHPEDRLPAARRKAESAAIVYSIGPFRLDSETGVLTKAGVPAALGSRAVAVLAALVERAHQYVPKGSIMDAAWPGVAGTTPLIPGGLVRLLFWGHECARTVPP